MLTGLERKCVQSALQVLFRALEDNRPVLRAVQGHIAKVGLPFAYRVVKVDILVHQERQTFARHARQESFLKKKLASLEATAKIVLRGFTPVWAVRHAPKVL